MGGLSRRGQEDRLMRILLTNDDGIHAEGLAVLERIARQLSDDVWVVAPEADQSGLAHSLSLSEPLRLRKIDDKPLRAARHADRLRHHGRAPADAEKPDLILSGVNSAARTSPTT
jgi:5'-nucleotidase